MPEVDLPTVPQAAEYLFANWLGTDQQAIWIGSGLSLPANFPTWFGALKTVCDVCEVDVPSPDADTEEWVAAADECKRASQQEYGETLHELFAPGPETHDRQAYSLLWNLNLQTYVTTNFDPLLYQRSVTRADAEEYVYREIEATTLGQDCKKAYYLHGLAYPGRDPDFVFSESEFDEAYQDPGLIENFVQAVLRGFNVLFVGCTLNDPALQPVFDEVQRILQRLEETSDAYSRPNHIILKDVPLEASDDATSRNQDINEEKWDELRAHYNDLGLDVVWYIPEDPRFHGEVEEILRTMNDLLGSGAPQS